MNRQFLSAGLFLFFMTSLMHADDMPEYGTAGFWTIRVDTSLGYGCFLHATFTGGSSVRLGVDKTDDSLYMLVGDPKWKSIEYGKNYSVQIKFGDEEKWSGDAAGFSFEPPDNQPWLWVNIVSDVDTMALFFAEFMQEQDIKLFYKDSSILHLSLKDSYKAGLKLFECQDAMNTLNEDPFRESDGLKGDDPFAS